MAAAKSGTAMPADGVDLVDEDNAGRVFLRLLEHVADPRRADAYEHLDEIRTRDSEEGHLGLAGDSPGQQRLTRTRRADHQHAARDLAAELLELGRVLQEIDQFLHLFLGLFAAGHVGKGYLDLVLGQHPRLALAKGHRAAPRTAALHLAHEENP